MAVHKVSLHVESQGEGPAIVLQHGFGGSARNFRPQARALSKAFRVIVFDARGHARSEAPPEASAYAVSEFVQDFAQVAGQAGEEPVVAGGLSMGALIGLHYALKFPDRVRGLVLSAFPSSGEDPRRRAWALDFADAIEQRGLDAAGAEFAWGERSRFDPKGAALIRQGFLEHQPHALAKILREVLASVPSPSALGPALAKLEMPALVVVGSEDRESFGPSHALVEALPNAELVVIPGAGHVVNLAKPSEFNAQLERFLNANVGPA